MRLHLFVRLRRQMMTLSQIRVFSWIRKDSSWSEALIGILAWAWGVGVLIGGAGYLLPEIVGPLELLASNWLWGSMLLLAGALHSLALCVGFKRLREPASVFGAFVWVFLGCLVLFKSGITAHFVVLALLSIFSLLAGLKHHE